MRDWEAAYVNDDTPWDKGTAAPPLRQFLARQTVSGLVAVPGCGTGHDVRLLAKQGASVTGLDIAESAVKKAKQFSVVNGEVYAVADFLDLSAEQHAAFDWVVEHTCLCALNPDQRSAYAKSVGQALKPGGYYLAIFFREVADYESGGPPHPISAEEIATLFNGAFERVESFVPTESYPSRAFGSEEVVLFRKR
jgi:SAM-dependent methyltransferase